MYIKDTIAAIATGINQGSIGIIRLSGADAFSVIKKISDLKEIEPNFLKLCYIKVDGVKVDQVLVSYMKSPHSFTGEDVVEINCHGGRVILNRVMKIILSEGIRLAEPGEFSKRAFFNDKFDLSQAEAIMDVVSAKTEKSAEMALSQLEGSLSNKINDEREKLLEIIVEIEAFLDFPDDMDTLDRAKSLDIVLDVKNSLSSLIKNADEGIIMRDGVATCIVGLPNVGKSSLLNYFLGKNRAIVSDIPGTTRDTIEEFCNVDGIPFKFIDTAGIRDIEHVVEKEGIERSIEMIKQSDLVLLVEDASVANSEFDKLLETVKSFDKKFVHIVNKIDLSKKLYQSDISVSVKNNINLDELKKLLVKKVLYHNAHKEVPKISNQRHIESLSHCLLALDRLESAIKSEMPLDFWTVDLKDAIVALGEITGADVTEEIIDKIFSSFCIGK